MNTTLKTADGTTTIEADPNLPLIKMTRDFQATPAQLVRAHTDPELFVKWVGPNGMDTHLNHWDARTGGSWRYVSTRGDEEYAFHGCFHEVRDDRLVQTFTYDGFPDGVSLETMWFEDLGDGRTRHARDLARGQPRGTRHDPVQRHGGRHQRRLRQARPTARGRRRLSTACASYDLAAVRPGRMTFRGRSYVLAATSDQVV